MTRSKSEASCPLLLAPMDDGGGCDMDELKIGDLISLDGRAFSVRGFDPMSLPEQRVELVEIETGVAIRVRLAQLQAFSVKRATAARALAASAAEIGPGASSTW